MGIEQVKKFTITEIIECIREHPRQREQQVQRPCGRREHRIFREVQRQG